MIEIPKYVLYGMILLIILQTVMIVSMTFIQFSFRKRMDRIREELWDFTHQTEGDLMDDDDFEAGKRLSKDR